MSTKYTGGFITKSPVAPTSSAASGIWTLDQQQQAQKAGTWPAPPNYIEEVFSTYLYTDTGSTQTIVNGIDLASKGGMVWAKCRSAVDDHIEWDSARGTSNYLIPNKTNAQATYAATFNSNGVSIPSLITGQTYASWTFREQPKFFDVVTWTGTGSNTTIAHNLGSVPGCIIVKRTDTAEDWQVYHRSLANTEYLVLNSTAAKATGATRWNSTTPTSTVFSLGTDATVNASGGTYVAYLFAHDAGGFGLTGTDNVISCGSFTPSGGGGEATVNLGYEPQWVLWKNADGAYSWFLLDNMRGIPTGSDDQRLLANSANAEGAAEVCSLTSTGFKAIGQSSGNNHIYIAIRRGPMKVPTVGTSVFEPIARSGTGSTTTVTGTSFPPDLVASKVRTGPANRGAGFFDRLRGATKFLVSSDTSAEQTDTYELTSFNMNGYTTGPDNQGNNYINEGSSTYVNWIFGRAPSFFDEVCYTGTGSVLSLTHNLTVAPEFILIKSRSDSSYWIIGSNFGASTYAYKNDWGYNSSSNVQSYSGTIGFNAQPTATTVSLSTNNALNVSASTYVMYMWATCAGVSKVGTYTGTGALQTINCGFTSGARFVLITRIGVVGDVNTYVYDSARGISSGNDPYLLLETSAVEVTGTNYVDTDTTGFKVTAAAPAGLNASGGTYIFLAIA